MFSHTRVTQAVRRTRRIALKDKLFNTALGVFFVLMGIGKLIQGFYFETCIPPEAQPCKMVLCNIDGAALICYMVNLISRHQWIGVASTLGFILGGLLIVVIEWLPPNKACT